MKIKRYKFIFTDNSAEPPTYSLGNKYSEVNRHCIKQSIDGFFQDQFAFQLSKTELSETELSIMLVEMMKSRLVRYIKLLPRIASECLVDANSVIAEEKNNIEIWEEKVRVLKEKPEYIFEIVQQ